MRLSFSVRVATALLLCGAATFPGFGQAGHAITQPSQRLLAALRSALEDRFAGAALSRDDQVVGIVALGGGIARTREAIRLARLFPAAKLVVTGASEEEYELARAQSATGQRVVIEPYARNTYENALFTKRMVQPKPGERWLIVTSATHMPRAMGSFLGVGFAVEAWPIRDVRSSDVHAAGVIRHEWLGLVAYRLTGRTDALFPAPFDHRLLNAPQGGPIRLGRARADARSFRVSTVDRSLGPPL